MMLVLYLSISVAIVASATGATMNRPKKEEHSLWVSPNDVNIPENRDKRGILCGLLGGTCRPKLLGLPIISCIPFLEKPGNRGVCGVNEVCCKKPIQNPIRVFLGGFLFGDPWYHTFDGKQFKFDGHGGCSYVLFQECMHVPTIVITVRHQYVEAANKTGIYQVTVYVDGNAVTTTVGRNVFFNGKEITTEFPWTRGGLKVSKYDEHVKINYDSKFTLLWNGRGRVVPTLDASMFGKICGLMGNADDNPDNDMQMRMPDGTLETTDDVNKLGESWRVPGSC